VYKFGKKSRQVLESLDEDLQLILTEAIKYIDISLIEGKRSKERQKELVKLGKAKTLDSKHVKGQAVDFAPYHKGIDWNNRENFIYYGGILMGIAFSNGIPLRFGGDWNRNGDLRDNNFDDLCHVELDY
jgi:peptidoglycan L-alanyl-D-glutamate endopeptidase CwlK